MSSCAGLDLRPRQPFFGINKITNQSLSKELCNVPVLDELNRLGSQCGSILMHGDIASILVFCVFSRVMFILSGERTKSIILLY